jgi:hypothetical protein
MPIYSHSRLETFETCPQKYNFRYIDEIAKLKEQTVEAFVGSRVHETPSTRKQLHSKDSWR